jgi:hypothetical protein
MSPPNYQCPVPTPTQIMPSSNQPPQQPPQESTQPVKPMPPKPQTPPVNPENLPSPVRLDGNTLPTQLPEVPIPLVPPPETNRAELRLPAVPPPPPLPPLTH